MKTQPIDNLTRALHNYLQRHPGDSLYTVSMDHSPSEQLTGRHIWHTTVLVLSMALEHEEMAQSLARRIRPKARTLTKWSNTGKTYRKHFLDEFMHELASFPVCVFAISASEASIMHSVDQFLSQLGLQDNYHQIESTGGRVRIRLNGFMNRSTGEDAYVVLSENRAAMCLFVAHFVLRMHRRMYEAANLDRPHDPWHINWNFTADKFPGPSDGDMTLMFEMLASLDRGTGRILFGHYRDSDTVASDLLADNLAGALNRVVGRQHPKWPVRNDSEGFFYWECWGLPQPSATDTPGASS